MVASDLEEVLAIERSGHPGPWSESIFREELDREWARLVVASSEDVGVLGFCNFWLVHDEVHLLNIVVHPQARRRGIGRALMAHILEVARARHSRYLTLEVRRSNGAAIELYESLGFRTTGVRPNYYAAEREDALVMLLALEGDGARD
jgi:ribosomal-protein-alanine N-acetyltransferase